MKTANDISAFYDEYSEKQQIMWHNERHYFLLELIKKTGLKNNFSILEIGCGIGAMTSLIAPLIKNGEIIASDISKKSIDLARKNCKSFKNIEFIIADSTNYNYPNKKYNFILLFDVLEHIQITEQESLLKTISSLMDDDTILLINVPAYYAHVYEKEHLPHLMQVIENPIKINTLLPLLEKQNLDLQCFNTYGLWQKDEYQYYIIKKQKTFTPIKLHTSNRINFIQQLKKKISRFLK